MSKRRVFDIEFPSDGEAASAPEPPSEPPAPAPRRGPMAAAIAENAEALASRDAAEAAIRLENDALAHEFVRLKRLGLIVDLVPVNKIETRKLTRDRSPRRDPEIDELKVSIQAIGLSNPIRVAETDKGYELVQGFRRLAAYRELHEETGDQAYARIPAGLIARGETLESLYKRMVDENLIRRDISFAEMAELARAYARDPETEARDVDGAIAALFGSAGRQKRNYILHFASLLDHLSEQLRYPEAISRALGLALEKRLVSEPGFSAQVRATLSVRKPKTAEEEVEILRALADGRGPAKERRKAPQARTSLRFQGPGGMIRCTAADGSILMRAERDFSTVDRHRLEMALDAFFRALDGETD